MYKMLIADIHYCFFCDIYEGTFEKYY